MKNYCLIWAILAYCCAYGQIFDVDTLYFEDNDAMYVIPFISSVTQPDLAHKLNKRIQQDIITEDSFDQTNYLKVLQKYREQQAGEFGTIWYNFDDVQQNDRVLRMHIDFEFIGAGIHSFDPVLIFDTHNAEQIKVEQLFTPQGYYDFCRTKWMQPCKTQYYTDLKDCNDPEVIANESNCPYLYNTPLQYSFTNDSIFFEMDSECFSRPDGPYFKQGYSISEATDYLSAYGKYILQLVDIRPINIEKITRFSGSIDAKYPFTMVLIPTNDAETTFEGFYFYDKQYEYNNNVIELS